MTEGSRSAPKGSGKASSGRPLPKRFYKAVTVSADADNRSISILIDGKTVRTPAKSALAVPSAALAESIAAEWESQREHIDPSTMPLTRLVNSAIDGVRGREASVWDDIVKYADSDLVCYRASEPEGLVRRQAETWDPILSWARNALGASLVVAQGVMPVEQPKSAVAAVGRALAGYDAMALAALHVVTTLTGSVILALAHAHGQLGLDETWAAAHVDEDWQIEKWGEDAEAAARRRRRWDEMKSASRFLKLLGPPKRV